VTESFKISAKLNSYSKRIFNSGDQVRLRKKSKVKNLRNVYPEQGGLRTRATVDESDIFVDLFLTYLPHPMYCTCTVSGGASYGGAPP
jgi:hypothetical protein